MTTIKYRQTKAFLDSSDRFPCVCLVHGEPYLVNRAFKQVCEFLTHGEKGGFSLEIFEAEEITMGDIIEMISTFSFFMSGKIIAVKNFNGDSAWSSGSGFSRLGSLIEKGFPENHFLILTADSIDKRKKIFKTIGAKGLIIDCTVAKGARKADIKEQNEVLRQIADETCARLGKQLQARAFHMLADLTGFDPRLLSRNIEKLAAYSGSRKIITCEHVQAVIKRDKKDPIFTLTNALMEKNLGQSLFYLDSLFKEGFHPLQILKAMENLFRRLVMFKCFSAEFMENHQGFNLAGINYNSFTKLVLPEIVKFDARLSEPEPESENLKNTKAKKTVANDLLLAPNPKNAYPVFQVFNKSRNFSLTELNHALIFLSDLDFRMKSSSFDERTQIETFIMNLCTKGGPSNAAQNQDSRHNLKP